MDSLLINFFYSLWINLSSLISSKESVEFLDNKNQNWIILDVKNQNFIYFDWEFEFLKGGTYE